MTDRSARILVVDDEEVVRTVMRGTLDRPGWYVVIADDGEQAIELLLEEHFDVLIADKNLPGITGLDVIRRAKAIHQSIGTLLVTAYASRESAEEALALGVDDYITKPFDVDKLRDKVKEIIEQQSGPKRVVRGAQKKQLGKRASRVVVLDPSSESKKLLVNGIETLGYKVHSADSLREVLQAVREKALDALVCDLETLGRDDATACFLRSALIMSPAVKFVAVASMQSMDGAIQAVHSGAGKVIYKPLLSEEYIAETLGSFLA